MKKVIISVIAIILCIAGLICLTTLNKDNEYVSKEFGYSFIEKDGKTYLSYGIKIDKLDDSVKLKNLKVEIRGCSKKNKILYDIEKKIGDITTDQVYFGGTEEVRHATPKVQIVLYYKKEKNNKKEFEYKMKDIENSDETINAKIKLDDNIKSGYSVAIFYKDNKIVGGAKSKTMEYPAGESNVEIELPQGLEYDKYDLYFNKK